MRFKTLILGGVTALLLGTGLTGVALAEAPKPTTTPSDSPVPAQPTKATEPTASPSPGDPSDPAPAVPSDAEPSYTG
jgi:hypothetical protein